MIYYDYQKDFPSGNGWSSNGEYYGEIISTPDYVFKTGKYQGRSLQQIIDRCWRGIIKYIDYGLIFITKDCFDSIVCDQETLYKIRAANDAKLLFCRVYSVNDELYSRPLACSVQGQVFIDVARSDPKYLLRLIFRGYYFYETHGTNSRFFAKDRSADILGDIDDITSILEQLRKKGVNNTFCYYLDNLIEELEYRERQEEERRRDAYEFALEEEERRYYQNEAYRDAFDGDPDAEWNID